MIAVGSLKGPTVHHVVLGSCKALFHPKDTANGGESELSLKTHFVNF